MKLRIAAVLSLTLALMGCSQPSASVAIASFGVAGVGLEVYCASGGNGCSPALVSYAALAVSQADADATIIGSGQATVAQIATVLANLNAYIAQGHQLTGLTAGQLTEVNAILNAAQQVVTLVALLNPAPVAIAPAAVRASGPVLTWPVTAKDQAVVAKMRAKIAAAKQ